MSGTPHRRVAVPAGRPTTGAAFFAPVLAPPTRARYIAPPWIRIPIETLPTVRPLHRSLGVTDDAIGVVLSKLTVWPTGLTFEVRMTPKPGDADARRAVSAPEFYGEAGGFGSAHLAKRFRIGIAYDDGRTATNLEIHADREATTPPPALLRLESGQGSSDGTTTGHWAWPIPATGDLTIVTAWTARGLPEQRTVLDGDALRDAAAQSQAAELWPGARPPAPTPPGEPRP